MLVFYHSLYFSSRHPHLYSVLFFSSLHFFSYSMHFAHSSNNLLYYSSHRLLLSCHSLTFRTLFFFSSLLTSFFLSSLVCFFTFNTINIHRHTLSSLSSHLVPTIIHTPEKVLGRDERKQNEIRLFFHIKCLLFTL